MILVDTDILSALAKVDRLSLLFTLLQTMHISIVPGVLDSARCTRGVDTPLHISLPDTFLTTDRRQRKQQEWVCLHEENSPAISVQAAINSHHNDADDG